MCLVQQITAISFHNLLVLSPPLFTKKKGQKRGDRDKDNCDNDCKVRTQEVENFDEEVKSLVSAWHVVSLFSPGSDNPLKTSSCRFVLLAVLFSAGGVNRRKKPR